MTQNVFKVVFSKKSLPLLILSCIMVEIILFSFKTEFVSIVLYIIFSFCAFLPGLFSVCASLLFYVQVNGSNVKVRTRSGRKYEFNTSDIEKVSCSIESTIDMGSFFRITIMARSKELCMECRMVGFREMAGYILEKYENGEIDKRAISEDCRKVLYQYCLSKGKWGRLNTNMFDLDENIMVITTRDIINQKKKVVLVFHDKEDDVWQFLDGEDVREENAALVSISEMVQLDPSICELWDLPLGWGAFRDDETQPWKWFEIENSD